MTFDPALDEATLSRLWGGQRFPASALVTRQGAALRVLHPGRRGRGAGPDFRDALIATPGGALLRGDVELHVRAADFRAHGHQRDRRYDGVVLHVVFEDGGEDETALANGRCVPVVPLAPWARRRAQELAAWLAGPERWREPCHDAVARLGADGVLATLEELGDGRFREREATLLEESREHGPGEALYRALLAGLSYGGDRAALAAVAGTLPWRELAGRLASAGGERIALAEALLLGAAGLLVSQRSAEPRHPHEHGLELRWLSSGLAGGSHWAPAGGVPPRPANHPARRLAALARLLARHGAVLEGREPPDALLLEPARELIEAWSAPAGGYWRAILAPGLASGGRRIQGCALIGRGRAIELLVNAVLPWVAAVAGLRGDDVSAQRARAAFAALPRPGRYGVLAFLEANLRADGRSLRIDARRQQGLLALYKTECTQGGCGRCALS